MGKLLENVHLLEEKIAYFRQLLQKILKSKNIIHKSEILDKTSQVQQFFSTVGNPFINKFSEEEFFIIKIIIACGQSEILVTEGEFDDQKIKILVDILLKVERFYDSLGGLLGYYVTALELLFTQLTHKNSLSENVTYSFPKLINIIKETPYVKYLYRRGIESLSMIGEMYPIGGAGDRLQLSDTITGELLPVAMLPFLGRSLLEGIIRDTQGREFLYFQLYNENISVPIAIMTSLEKNNRQYIENLLEKNKGFGKPRHSYFIFDQPLVPVISESGNWIIKDYHELTLKPGGHGVLWKQAFDEGVFNWFKQKHVNKLLVRQINNPLASTDYGILSLLGYGFDQNKAYGVLSCKRLVHSPEGMNVLCERKIKNGYEYGIINIEYTEFAKKGIQDLPSEENGLYSVYPSNTNILFVDIVSIIKAIEVNPIPGTIINMKTEFTHFNPKGKPEGVLGGRLESTMQNIVDVMFDFFPQKKEIRNPEDLKTFLLFYERHKTISVTKNSFKGMHQLEGTPLHAHYTLLNNYYELFKNYCDITLPPLCTFEEYVNYGPNFIVDLHPALGPLWSIISQKIKKGKFHEHSEILLEIANLDIKNIELEGSLIIEAKNPMGIYHQENKNFYSQAGGRCTFHNVTIKNAGIDKKHKNIYWSNEIHRKESFSLILHGNSEFYAKDVVFNGNYFIEIEDGYSVEAFEINGEIRFVRKKILNYSWNWDYQYDQENNIVLRKRFNP